MVNSKIKKGFLLDTGSDTLGALEDPRSLEKPPAENWGVPCNTGWGVPCDTGASVENWGDSWNKGAEWDKYSDLRGNWGVESTDKDNQDDAIIDDDETKKSHAEVSMDSILENRPFLPRNLGVPKNVLSVWYGKRYKDMTFEANKCFTTWHDEGPSHERYWTSVFTCPVTGEVFSCARHGDKTSYKIERESIQGASGNDEAILEAKTVSTVWYRKKSLAEHSAAARALDCLSFREGDGISTMSYGLCIDKPYIMASEAPPLSNSAPKSLRYDIVDEMECTETIEENPMLEGNKTKTTLFIDDMLRNEFEFVYESVIAKRESPKSALVMWYDKNLKENPVSSNCFTIWHDNGKPHARRYTGVFTCPKSGEIFGCGQYGEVENYVVKEEEMNVLVVWYRKKTLVEHAASARALDCMNLRKAQARSSHSRLCVEEPYFSFGDAPPLSSSAPVELGA